MTGNWITHEQKRVYMKKRKEGDTEEVAAAKSGISLRSAQRIETKQPKANTERSLHNGRDPFQAVWESELVPLLQKNTKLQAISLLHHLQMKFAGQYPDSLLRTLQRRVRDWKIIYGPQKEIIFRQKHLQLQLTG